MKNKFLKQLLKQFSNLRFAIILLFLICCISAIGTIIEQNQTLQYYQTNYPITNPLFGFFSWQVIYALQLDHVYTSNIFILILGLFSASLISCTFTTQLPNFKKVQSWKFLKRKRDFKKSNYILTDTEFSRNTLLYQFYLSKYQIYKQGNKTFLFNGLSGRIAPILVHFSLLLLITGVILSSFSSFTAQEMVPRGEVFHVQNIINSGPNSYINQNQTYRINDFWTTYTADSKINQFYSDISVLNNKGEEELRKTIFVNEPLIYKNTVIYQTDWDVLGIKLKLPNDKIIQLPLKKVNNKGNKFWFSNFEINQTKFSIVLNNLMGKVFLYDRNGTLVTEAQLGEKINLDFPIIFNELIVATGIQIKVDLGIKLVFLSFFFLIISTYTSFLSYSQIWIYENMNQIYLRGETNRAVLGFQKQIGNLVKKSM